MSLFSLSSLSSLLPSTLYPLYPRTPPLSTLSCPSIFSPSQPSFSSSPFFLIQQSTTIALCLYLSLFDTCHSILSLPEFFICNSPPTPGCHYSHFDLRFLLPRPHRASINDSTLTPSFPLANPPRYSLYIFLSFLTLVSLIFQYFYHALAIPLCAPRLPHPSHPPIASFTPSSTTEAHRVHSNYPTAHALIPHPPQILVRWWFFLPSLAMRDMRQALDD